MEFNIGKVIPQFKGRYTTKEIYEELDVVAHNGCTWVSQSNNNQTEPSEDNTKWKLECNPQYLKATLIISVSTFP